MKVKLNKVRLAFPNLFNPVEFRPGDKKPRYDATFLVVPGSANDKAIAAAIKDAVAEKFPAAAEAAKFLKGVVGQKNQYCYLDGDTKEYDGYEGMLYLACHSKVRPLVIDRDKSPLTEQDGKPYGGCYVNATVEIYCIKDVNPGVFASFTGVQFDSDGDSFGGGKPASTDDFDDLGTEDDGDLA